MESQFNILEINSDLINNLKSQYPDSFNDISINGNKLTFQNESCNISKFNLYNLLYGDSLFGSSLSYLTANDVYRIIELHVNALNENQIRQFYNLISSHKQLPEAEQKQISRYFSIMESLLKYEDYLLPELRSQVTRFVNYVTEIETREDNSLSLNEQATLNKYYDMKMNIITEDKVLDNNIKLEKRLEDKGSISTVELIWIITALAAILTGLTIFLTK